jgi:hypothetical protein
MKSWIVGLCEVEKTTCVRCAQWPPATVTLVARDDGKEPQRLLVRVGSGAANLGVEIGQRGVVRGGASLRVVGSLVNLNLSLRWCAHHARKV